MNLKELFSPESRIAELLKGYEQRPQQLEMAQRIEKAIIEKKHLVAEAGTGVGKSIAYLVPFILWTGKNKKRAVISTYTKTLQEQLTKKELPFLREALSLEFKFALCVGSGNYVCLRRLNRGRQFGLFDDAESKKQWNRLAGWCRKTETGLKMDIDFNVRGDIWANVSREGDLCFGRKCPYRSGCFYMKARILQTKANILVVNHHLFFTNIASGGRLLPNYDAVLFDEAQNVEDVATEYLGVAVSNRALEFLLRLIYNPAGEKGAVLRLSELKDETRSAVKKAAVNAEEAARTFFASIADEFGTARLTRRIRNANLFENTLDKPLSNLYACLKAALADITDEESAVELSAYAERCIGIRNGLKIFIEQSEKDYVYWIDITPGTRNLTVSVHAVPVEVAGVLRKELYEKTRPVILTSATLSVDRSFGYIKERLGLEEADEIMLGSPFDYGKQALLYIAEDLPDPSYDTEKFTIQAVKRTKEILEISGGGTFALFTSYSTLDAAYDCISAQLPGLQLLKQGALPRWKLLSIFKKSGDAVILGTSTFWQGIDVPGRALRCVIIFKLPFAVPDHPVTEAKMEYLKKHGRDPFRHYQVPQAVLMLKQGAGRLIRAKTDRGVIAILDPRIISRNYGKTFARSLPECGFTTTLKQVVEFFKREEM
ncbi:MAG: ATP-dependent DNA helicase [bacterium]